MQHCRASQDDASGLRWLAGVEALLAKRLVPQHEIGLRFALGKYYDDTLQYDQAFGEIEGQTSSASATKHTMTGRS